MTTGQCSSPQPVATIFASFTRENDHQWMIKLITKHTSQNEWIVVGIERLNKHIFQISKVVVTSLAMA